MSSDAPKADRIRLAWVVIHKPSAPENRNRRNPLEAAPASQPTPKLEQTQADAAIAPPTPSSASPDVIAIPTRKRKRNEKFQEVNLLLAKRRTSSTVQAQLESAREDLEINEGLLARHEEETVISQQQLAQKKENEARAAELEDMCQQRNARVEAATKSKKAWKSRTRALYKMLLQEVQAAHGGNPEGLNEIKESLHRTFGVYLKE
ncbi:hypothetical protein EK21DRAFT_107703 [Setomelanomma holmii]|uniref:Uncharacterized protein n=1 Tax=Setomelanomma holmii TaxID=210430 RepID=A0A9P4HJ87_9PLEO|nr:hypothetical protein EK21DRAFT_107703 [Setomelanomma holmii]